jgi:hypothetical protein
VSSSVISSQASITFPALMQQFPPPALRQASKPPFTLLRSRLRATEQAARQAAQGGCFADRPRRAWPGCGGGPENLPTPPEGSLSNLPGQQARSSHVALPPFTSVRAGLERPAWPEQTVKNSGLSDPEQVLLTIAHRGATF